MGCNSTVRTDAGPLCEASRFTAAISTAPPEHSSVEDTVTDAPVTCTFVAALKICNWWLAELPGSTQRPSRFTVIGMEPTVKFTPYFKVELLTADPSVETFSARKASMMGGDRIFAEPFLQCECDSLSPSAAKGKDQRRLMIADQLSDRIVHCIPMRMRREGA